MTPTRKKLTVCQHKEIAHRLTDPRVNQLVNLISDSTGKSSRSSQKALSLLDCMLKLRCELEGDLARDHPGIDHTGIYWPQA